MELNRCAKTNRQELATQIGMNYFLPGDQVQGYVILSIPGCHQKG
jgi:hypothetical protein